MKTGTIWQGTDKTFNVVHDYSDLPSATEVEVYIDSKPQIIKTLGDGVTGVSATNYTLTVAGEDTENIESGEYRIQARITTSTGSRVFGRILPDKVRIRDSVFTPTE